MIILVKNSLPCPGNTDGEEKDTSFFIFMKSAFYGVTLWKSLTQLVNEK